MPTCTICGEELTPEQKVCDTCGTSVATSPTAAASFSSPPPLPPSAPRSAPPAPPVTNDPAPPFNSVSGSNRACPLCRTQYAADYQDEFCRCGGELVAADSIQGMQTSTESLLAGPFSPEVPAFAPPPPESPATSFPVSSPAAPSNQLVRPQPGTVCLVVYSEQKLPIHYCSITKDVTMIGRSDPVRGDFPDLDLSEMFDNSLSRKISRKHAMILRSRTTGNYSLRPLGGNTGTQVEKELAVALQDYPLTSGTRIVLGGIVRLKFEIIT